MEESRVEESDFGSSEKLQKVQNSTILNLAPSTWSTETYTYIYGGIMSAMLLVTVTKSLTFYQFCTTASQKLHDTMFRGLIQTSMRFFDTNPSGRIMNRFSKDLGSADETLPRMLVDTLQFNLIVIGSILVTIFTNFYFAIVILLMSAFFILASKIFLKSSMNIKRLEGISEIANDN